MKLSRLVAGLLISATASAAWAAEPAKVDPAKGQQIAQTVCAACHAADGNSVIPANPKLAGQHAEYIYKQLSQFKAPADPKKPENSRKNAVMNGVAANLSDDDMKSLAAYFSSQKVKPGTGKGKEVVALGEKIYRGGIKDKGVPACMACHGPSGAGMPAQFPRLGSQNSDYVVAQMTAFRKKERLNDPNHMMRDTAAKMSDDEIKAVAEYVAGLH